MATNHITEVIQNICRGAALRDGAGLTDGQLLESYIEHRDEAAFAALVRRHGPLVWGVCLRVLRSRHDAEDAFQATFLVLVRKSASLACRGLLANWLYGVAYNTAIKARSLAARRRAKERQVTEMPEPEPVRPDPWHDLEPLLDQELSRLPDKYRSPVVLCDLEGKTRREAALLLGWPEGTVAGRLARARAMLAKRLAPHGLTLPAGTLAGELMRNAASASVPASVLFSTIKAAGGFAAGHATAAAAVKARVAALAEGVMKSMLLTKIKAATAVVLALTLLTATVGVVSRNAAAGQGEPREQPERKSAEGPVTAEKSKEDQDQKDDTAWGKEQGGVQAGLGYRPGQRRAYRLGETVTIVIRVRNVGKEKVTLQYPRQCVIENPPTVTDADGKPANLSPFSKARRKKELVEKQLAPGEDFELDSLDIALKPDGEERADVPTLFARPGKYRVRMNRLAPIESSNILSLLATGELELEVLDAANGKDGDKEPAAKPRADRELIQGKWEVAKVEVSGPHAADEGKDEKQVVVAADTMTVVYPTRTNPMTYTLDPMKEPKAIDLAPAAGAAEKGESFKGIYKLEDVLGLGDQLTICFSRNTAKGAERPTTFERGKVQEDRPRTVYVLNRPAVTKADLHGEWESPVNGVFESGWLSLRPDGTFRYEQHDVALGWTTTVTGTWKLEDDRSLALQEQERLQDGRPVKGNEKQAEKMCAICKGGEWTLSSYQGGVFLKVKKDKSRIPSTP